MLLMNGFLSVLQCFRLQETILVLLHSNLSSLRMLEREADPNIRITEDNLLRHTYFVYEYSWEDEDRIFYRRPIHNFVMDPYQITLRNRYYFRHTHMHTHVHFV